jgi:hypothetical protein
MTVERLPSAVRFTLGVQMHSSHLLDVSTWLTGRWGLFLCGLFVIVFFILMLRRGERLYFRTQRWRC